MPTKKHIMRQFVLNADILADFTRENYRGVEFYVLRLGDEEQIKHGSYGMRPSDIRRIANKYVFSVVIKDRDKWGKYITDGTPSDSYWRHKIIDGSGNFLNGSIRNCSSAIRDIDGGGWSMPPLGIKVCSACGYLSRESKCFYSPSNQRPRTCVYCGDVLSGKRQKEFGYCPSCAERIANSRHCYHDWGLPPRFSNPKERDKKLHMGTEVEFHTNLDDYDDWDESENNNTVAYATRKIGEVINKDVYAPFWHFERDRSLHNYGIECISEPLTLSAYKKYAPTIQKAFDTAVVNGCYVNSNAGVHIHIDRKWFNGHDKLGSLNLAYLLNAFTPEINCFAGRKQTDYCVSSSIAKDDDVLQSWTKLCNNGGHHNAVNISNHDTIEFRIWASTTSAEDLLMYLDFTQALAKIAKFKKYETLANIRFAEVGKYLAYRSTIDIMEMRGLHPNIARDLRARYDATHSDKKD